MLALVVPAAVTMGLPSAPVVRVDPGLPVAPVASGEPTPYHSPRAFARGALPGLCYVSGRGEYSPLPFFIRQITVLEINNFLTFVL